MTTLSQAAEQMLACGMPSFPDGLPIADGRIHRYGKKKRAWYRLRELPRRNGGTFIAGHFGIWGQLERARIEADFSGIDDEERERLRATWQAREQAERDSREKRALYAARRASAQWRSARSELPAGVRCPYLQRKAIAHEPGAFRYLVDGEVATLVVPMVRYDVNADPDPDDESAAPRRIVGLQKIAPDGEKRFNKGTAKAGASCLLGKPPKDGAPILFVEGVATGESIRMALERGYPVVVCFDAGNIIEVARIYRKLYPKSPFLFCADDDAYLFAQLNARLRGDFDVAADVVVSAAGEVRLPAPAGELLVRVQVLEDERGVPGISGAIEMGDKRYFVGIVNAGRTKANAAQFEVGNAWVCYPRFKSVVVDLHGRRELPADPAAPRLTDFNDLHTAEGLDAVRAQLLEALAFIAVPAKADAAAKEEERRRREEEKKKKQADKEKQQQDFAERLGGVLDRYTLIYPSKEAWDAKLEEIVKLDHVGALYGGAYVEAFTQSQRKRVVWAKDVVFDPAGEVDQLEDGRINLFRGLEIKRGDSNECPKLLGLLFYLCGDEKDVYDWVLKWLALPLQRPGAKMSTALVLHGEEEGTGKNLFFSAMTEIYGKHGGFITQRQLESSFNTWQSAKLFMVANEVVTRAEMRHQSGYVRHLITEPKIWINPKMINEREEDNHMQLVFLSNENQALLVPRKDRRFVVIRTPGPLEEARYKEVVEELKNGGAGALYDFLLKLDLGDFHTHTKPIWTQAKEDMIQLGLASPQLFWQDFHEGEFQLPYQPCLREDLYRAYLAWCARYGEKMPKRINQFIPEFRCMNGVKFDRVRIAWDGVTRQRRVAIMGDKPDTVVDQEDERAWIEASCIDFNRKLGQLRGDSQ